MSFRVPAELWIVVFLDGGVTSFLSEAEAREFSKRLKRETVVARYVLPQWRDPKEVVHPK